MKSPAFCCQSEEIRGYQELAAAAKRVDPVLVAMCTVKDVWADYNISSDTIVLFRKVLYLDHKGRVVEQQNSLKLLVMIRMMMMRRNMMMMQADRHQEKLDLAKAKKIDADGLVNFITINEVRYVTEYNQAVSLPPASVMFCSSLVNSRFCFFINKSVHFFH